MGTSASGALDGEQRPRRRRGTGRKRNSRLKVAVAVICVLLIAVGAIGGLLYVRNTKAPGPRLSAERFLLAIYHDEEEVVHRMLAPSLQERAVREAVMAAFDRAVIIAVDLAHPNMTVRVGRAKDPMTGASMEGDLAFEYMNGFWRCTGYDLDEGTAGPERPPTILEQLEQGGRPSDRGELDPKPDSPPDVPAEAVGVSP